jgi:hypothetical protein
VRGMLLMMSSERNPSKNVVKEVVYVSSVLTVIKTYVLVVCMLMLNTSDAMVGNLKFKNHYIILVV